MQIRNFDGNGSSGKYKKQKRIDFRSPIITERFLTLLLKVISCPKITKKAIFINVQSFMNQVNATHYEKDPNVYALILAVNIVIKNRLENVDDREDLVEYVNLEIMDNYEDQKNNIVFPTILSADEVTEKEKSIVLKTIDTYVRYQSVLEKKDDLSDIISDIGSGNISNLDQSLEALNNVISAMYDEFRKTDISREAYSFIHTTEDEDFKESLSDAHAYAISDKVCLHTGLKAFNEMLSTRGGFLGGKFYMFYADTNTFKSALLKYCTKWIQKYNGEMFKEEYLATGKRPTILYVSLEDGAKEDTSRMFTTYTGKDLMSMETFEEAEEEWKKGYNSSGSIIDITQVNSSEAAISLSTVEGFIKRLEEENYFIIAVVIDSFDLMAPSDDDIYRGITDEMTLFGNRAKAIQKYIGDKPYPWITAHQLNRSGNLALTEKKDKGCVDLAKTLGRGFISGSYDIERRVHFSAFIYTEWSKYDNELYLEIFRQKVKYKKTPRDYFVHWLENGFVIHDDYGTSEFLSRDSILPTEEDFAQGAKDIGSRGISSIANMKENLGVGGINEQQQNGNSNNSSVIPMASATSGIPLVLPTFIPFIYSIDTPNAFTMGNPFEMNRCRTIKSDDGFNFVMPGKEYGVNPFNLGQTIQ